jgi:hypothetical protein
MDRSPFKRWTQNLRNIERVRDLERQRIWQRLYAKSNMRGKGMGVGRVETQNLASLPPPLNFFETAPWRSAFMELRLLTVKFRSYNQQTKFRIKDGTLVRCFKSTRV